MSIMNGVGTLCLETIRRRKTSTCFDYLQSENLNMKKSHTN